MGKVSRTVETRGRRSSVIPSLIVADSLTAEHNILGEKYNMQIDEVSYLDVTAT
jgi:hypothetical protein